MPQTGVEEWFGGGTLPERCRVKVYRPGDNVSVRTKTEGGRATKEGADQSHESWPQLQRLTGYRTFMSSPMTVLLSFGAISLGAPKEQNRLYVDTLGAHVGDFCVLGAPGR